MTSRSKHLWYADNGLHQAPVILWIHGAGKNHLDYPAPLAYLPGYRTLIPDLPGHGQSAPPGYDRVEAYATTLINLLDELGIEQAIVGGQSMGGAIAQTLARMHPARIEGLILIGTGARLVVNEVILKGLLETPEATCRQIVRWSWSRGTPETILQEDLNMLLKTPGAITHGDYVACQHFDAREHLSAIACPALVISGEADKMTPPAWGRTLADGIPQATYAEIAGAGHMMVMEQPDQVAQHIQRWLATSFHREDER